MLFKTMNGIGGPGIAERSRARGETASNTDKSDARLSTRSSSSDAVEWVPRATEIALDAFGDAALELAPKVPPAQLGNGSIQERDLGETAPGLLRHWPAPAYVGPGHARSCTSFSRSPANRLHVAHRQKGLRQRSGAARGPCSGYAVRRTAGCRLATVAPAQNRGVDALRETFGQPGICRRH